MTMWRGVFLSIQLHTIVETQACVCQNTAAATTETSAQTFTSTHSDYHVNGAFRNRWMCQTRDGAFTFGRWMDCGGRKYGGGLSGLRKLVLFAFYKITQNVLFPSLESQSHCVSSCTKRDIPSVLFFFSPLLPSPSLFPCLVCDISMWKDNKSHVLISTRGSLYVQREWLCRFRLLPFQTPFWVFPVNTDCIWITSQIGLD